MANQLFIELKNLTKTFRNAHNPEPQVALNGVSLSVSNGEMLALVGESGSGKSTLGKCLVRLEEADSGQLYHVGRDLFQLPLKQFRREIRSFQMVFQNPAGALDPMLSVSSALLEVLRVCRGLRGDEAELEARRLLYDVGLDDKMWRRKPQSMSGGEKQRLVIARALAARPSFLIADEPTSSLDAANRGAILMLLRRLQKKHDLTVLLITHDIGAVLDVADRMAVLKEGRIVEECVLDESFWEVQHHSYTRELLRATHLELSSGERAHEALSA